MSEKIEMMATRAKLVEDQRAILDKAETEKRELNTEETAKYNAMEAEFNRITRVLELREKEDYLKTSYNAPTKPMPSGGYSQKPQQGGEIRVYSPGSFPRVEDIRLDTQDQKDIEEYFRHGELRLSREALGRFQKRSLQADKDAAGGYLVMPEQFVSGIIAEIQNSVFVRKNATIISLKNAASLGAPALKDDIGDPTWTGELSIGSSDETMDFSKRNLFPHPLARYIKASKTLVRQSPQVVEFIRERLGGKFATVQEHHFLNGNGVNSPLGVFTASASGISTARDCSTGATATAMTADHLIECAGTLKSQYAKGARWCFHRNAITKIRKLKDGEGNYLWQAGLALGQPDSLLGFPVDSSEYCPNTFTTTQYVGILANWKFYWIVDALDMEIQVLTELYAETNQNGYVGRLECDGAPVDENGFVRVKLA